VIPWRPSDYRDAVLRQAQDFGARLARRAIASTSTAVSARSILALHDRLACCLCLLHFLQQIFGLPVRTVIPLENLSVGRNHCGA
jgi:hypothetical protein